MPEVCKCIAGNVIYTKNKKRKLNEMKKICKTILNCLQLWTHTFITLQNNVEGRRLQMFVTLKNERIFERVNIV